MSDPLLDLVRLVGAPLVSEQPWVGWLLVALCRQRARQSWLLEVHERYLADVDEQVGDVPGLEGWRYAFHGTGLCLRGPGGDLVDMDFDHEPAGATIDPYFFAGRVRAYQSGHPETRLRALLPSSDWIARGIDALRRIGAVHHPTSGHVFQLAPRLEHGHPQIAAIDFGSKGARVRWREALGDDERGLQRTRAWAMEEVRSERRNVSLLRNHMLTTDQVEELALAALDGPVDSYVAGAVDALHETGRTPPDRLVALLDRLDPAEHHPYPAHAVCRALLAVDVERARCLEVLEAFAAVDVVKGYLGNPYRDHLAVLVSRYDAERGWALFRLAVHGSTPGVYEPIGALLALFPDDRAPRLLLEAALASEDTQRRFLLACLAHRDDDVSRALAAEHMPPPPERSGAFGYTFEEVQYANLRGLLERRLEGARETLALLRPT